jgi:hypothetical protein
MQIYRRGVSQVRRQWQIAEKDPFVPATYIQLGLREDRAATDVRRKPRAADSAQIEGPGISPLGGPLASNVSQGGRVLGL